MMKFKSIVATDYCNKVADGTHDSPKRQDKGKFLITSRHIKGRSIDFENAYLISEQDFNQINQRSKVDQWDILISMIGEYCGFSYVERNEIVDYAVKNVGIFKTGNKIKAEWLYYYLISPEGKNTLLTLRGGTSQPYIPLGALRALEIPVPEDETKMEQIVSTLSSLDDKIELNLQMNQTLEAMAQAIFKEWFVNFNFPGFNGEWVDASPATGGRLPKGWRIGKVADVCEVNANTLNAKDDINEIHYIEISEVDKGIIKNKTTYKRGEEPSRAKRKLLHGDVALSTVRPNRGSYFLAIHPERNLIASTGFAIFTPTKIPFSFLYNLLTGDEQIEYYGKMADGAAYPAINPTVIMNIDFSIPSDEVLKMFNDVVENYYLRIANNWKENRILSQIRDSLLPKLMTGKISLNQDFQD